MNPSTFPETSSPQSCQSASGLSRHSACGVFQKLGFKIYATEGTAKFYEKAGVKCEVVNKIAEGRPNVLDIILNKQVNLIINTPWAKRDAIKDESAIRKAAIKYKVPYITTLAGAYNTVKGIAAARNGHGAVNSLQEYHASIEEI